MVARSRLRWLKGEMRFYRVAASRRGGGDAKRLGRGPFSIKLKQMNCRIE
jgi:hypothetical protein